MIYVEWLRARQRLAIVGGVLLALVLLAIATVYFGHIKSGAGHDFSISSGGYASGHPYPLMRDELHLLMRDTAIPAGAFLVLGAFVACFFTTTLYTSLHAQRSSLDLAFTKPLARIRLAATFFGIDFAAIVACYAVATILFLLPFAVFGLLDHVVPDAEALLDLILGLGICVLLYGLMQLATAWLRGGGAIAIIGALWVTFIVVASVGHVRITNIEAILRVLRPLDPIRYFGLLTYSSGAHPQNLGPPTLLAWSLGLAACALAAFTWQRIEV